MKKFYEEPELIVRNYVLPPNECVTTSQDIDHDDKDPWNSQNQRMFTE